MAFPIATPAKLIGQLYVGYFGRAADPAGLDYWVNCFNDGMSLLEIANSFAVQPEATSLYSYLAAPSLGDPHAFIAAIYSDLFNRAPDADGLAYWVDQLTVHGTPPGQMVLDIISGAQGTDRTTIENKTHVAVVYAQTSDSALDAHAAVASVTDDPATVFAVFHGVVVTGFGAHLITTTMPKYPATFVGSWVLGEFNNTLIGGVAADTIVAKGTGPGFGSNFIWGGLGGDIETGVAGGAAGDVGTVFLINDRAESPGNVPYGPSGTIVHITNFRGGADTLLINPVALTLGDLPMFIGNAVGYGNALALLAGGGAERTQAVYQLDDRALWIDADNNGLLNAFDIKVLVDFSDAGFRPGSINFGSLLQVFDGPRASAYIDAIVPQGSKVIFSGTLLPGEALYGYHGGSDTLTLDNGAVANGIVTGLERLEIAAGRSGELSVAQWNSFGSRITGLGASTAVFSDGAGIPETALTAVATVTNYDFSRLSNGISMSTGAGGPMNGPGTITGTRLIDTFSVGGSDLKASFLIDGGGSADVLHLDAKADISDSAVTNIEILELASGASVAMNAQTWDQFVGSNGFATPGHVVAGTGWETVTLVATTAGTAAYVGDNPIEGYVLSSDGNDFLRIHQGSSTYDVQVTLTGGGSDFLILDNTVAGFGDNNLAVDLFGFAAGAIVDTSDVLQIRHRGSNISSRGFEAVTAAAADIGAAIGTVAVDSSIATIAGPWNQTAARTALDAAIGGIAVGEYAMVVYSGINAQVMAVRVNTADSLLDASIDLVGMLHGVGANALVGANFA